MDGRLKRDDALAHTKSGILCLFCRGVVVAIGFLEKRQHGADQSMPAFSFSFLFFSKRRASHDRTGILEWKNKMI